MKKSFMLIAIVATLAGCSSNTKTSDEKTSTDTTIHTPVSHDVYACPMDCEKGKTYDKAGKCPVCEMDLEKK